MQKHCIRNGCKEDTLPTKTPTSSWGEKFPDQGNDFGWRKHDEENHERKIQVENCSVTNVGLTYLALTGFRVDFRTASSKATDLQIEIASQKRLDSDSRIEEPRKITVKSVNHVVTLG